MVFGMLWTKYAILHATTADVWSGW